MELELRCPTCKRFFINPVMLSCSHNMCLTCASSNQVHTPPQINIDDGSQSTTSSSNSGTDMDLSDLDKLSLISEADSGVICTSRPGSFAGTPSVGNLSFPGFNTHAFGLTCPLCKKTSLLDEHGAKSLPKNKLLESIVDKHTQSLKVGLYCQLCSGDSTPSTKMCLQCKVFYCDKCVENCHPSRGPFVDHKLVSPLDGKATLQAEHISSRDTCAEHINEPIDMFCNMCKITVCHICVKDGCHMNHDVQSLSDVCKSRKVSYVMSSYINTYFSQV